MNSKRIFTALAIAAVAFTSCQKEIDTTPINQPEVFLPENPSSFKELASIDLGGETAAEITAYDPLTKKLFVVSNDGGAKVEVVDLASYPTVTKLRTLAFPNNAGINSVAVYNGSLAIALDGISKQANGDVVVYKTSDLTEVKKVAVGAMPDMVTFTPDGNYILTANEGEPSDDYTVDPVGSISVINVKDNYTVKTFDFTSFESQKTVLLAAGFRIYGGPATNKSSFAQDIEPEYIAVAKNSKKAWVTLQENNAVAEIDIVSGKINKITALGTKDISRTENAFDVSDRDNKQELITWPIKAYYLPDAISYFETNETAYLALANEGDTRDWAGYKEEARVKDLTLDAVKFPNGATLKQDAQLGRLTVTRSYGDIDGDGDFDELYVPGGRSATIINAVTGVLVSDIGKDLETRVIAAGKYEDDRSDNKGVEVEAVTVAKVNGKSIAFIGMERVDLVAVYDVSIPSKPVFLQFFQTGDAPEGILFINAKDSPNNRSLVIVASEADGVVKFYQPDKI